MTTLSALQTIVHPHDSPIPLSLEETGCDRMRRSEGWRGQEDKDAYSITQRSLIGPSESVSHPPLKRQKLKRKTTKDSIPETIIVGNSVGSNIVFEATSDRMEDCDELRQKHDIYFLDNLYVTSMTGYDSLGGSSVYGVGDVSS